MVELPEPAAALLPACSALPSQGPAVAAGERRRERQQWERTAALVNDLWGAPTTHYYRRREMALVSRAFGSLEGRRVLKLDLWNEAFNTRIGHWMQEQGARLFALDLSQTVTSRARFQSSGPRRFLCADIRELPFAECSFDCLYTMGTIEHVVEYRQTLREIRRVLRPGGLAVVGVPFRWDPFLRPVIAAGLSLVGKYPYAPERSFGAGELRRDLEGAGLEVLERTGILAVPGWLRMADLFCHRRRLPLRPLWRALAAPFEYCEARVRSLGRIGYLMAMIVRRPAGG
jgi:SAM-dependent methyltransferase